MCNKKEIKIIKPQKKEEIKAIYDIINYYANKGLLLYRSIEEIEKNKNFFYIAINCEGEVLGCVSKKIYSEDLIEVRSLAVKEKYKMFGIGRMLVKKIISEENGKKVFALTYTPEFFTK